MKQYTQHYYSPIIHNISKYIWTYLTQNCGEGNGTPLQYSCLENPMDRWAWWAAVHGVAKRRTRLSDFTFTFHFHALEKEMATHFSVLAWRIPGMGEPGGLLSMGLHRVGHDLSNLAAGRHHRKGDFKVKSWIITCTYSSIKEKRRHFWQGNCMDKDTEKVQGCWGVVALLFGLAKKE